ncbi:Vegetative incompatibility protein HET-E-1 [Colletotrichum fructicola]|nr:Vegetative incompatibility protein HET-E-1 [Colletotrichum fructicola]
MKLINVHNLEIETFNAGDQVPRYAILSHTWGSDEISFQEWITNCGNPSPEYLEKDGYLKIINACSKTRDDKLRYLWVDTICIDKSSSAELSEAINSMFAWMSSSIRYTPTNTQALAQVDGLHGGGPCRSC